MVFEGTVQNGVVVFPFGISLPDGTAVRVEATPPAEHVAQEESDPVFRMGDLAVDTGIPDLAVNIDHYLYGHPKATDGQ